MRPAAAIALLTPFVVAATGVESGAYFNNARWVVTATNDVLGPRGAAATLTWGIAADGTLDEDVLPGLDRTSNLIARLDGWFGAGPGGTDLTQCRWFGYLQSSFDRWGEVSGLRLVYEPAEDGAAHNVGPGILGVRRDIHLAGARYDGTVGGNLGTTAYAIAPDKGDVLLDTDDVGYFSNSSNSAFFPRRTLMHEIGHSLGLGHITSGNATILMEPFPQTAFDGPQLDDIHGVQFLYGERGPATRRPPPRPLWGRLRGDRQRRSALRRCSRRTNRWLYPLPSRSAARRSRDQPRTAARRGRGARGLPLRPRAGARRGWGSSRARSPSPRPSRSTARSARGAVRRDRSAYHPSQSTGRGG